jgi:hypothetical protein
VRWIFQQRLAGRSVADIARALNERVALCPSIMDATRNGHRHGDGWSLRTRVVRLPWERLPDTPFRHA